MKLNFNFYRTLSLASLVAGLGWICGCDSFAPLPPGYGLATPTATSTPGIGTPTPTPSSTPCVPAGAASRSLINDFETPPPNFLNINPYLFELSNPPCYTLLTPGGVTFVNNFPLYVTGSAPYQTSGYNGSGSAAHLNATINDPGTGSYPAADLQVQMEGGAQYNASFFSGVKFHLNVSSLDNATKRVFAIPLYNTQGAPQGGCVANCYDHFSISYSTIVQDTWVPFIVNFRDMTRAGFGSAITPSTLSGANLGKVLWLMWEESRDNTAGTSTVDFSVDQIEFF